MQLSPEQLKEISDGSLRLKSLVDILKAWVDEMKDEVVNGSLSPEAGRTSITKVKELLGKLAVNEQKTNDANKFV